MAARKKTARKKKSTKKATKKKATKKKARTTTSGAAATTAGFDANNRMHERLFLVLSYQNQLSLSADFAASGELKLSALPYWQSVSGAGLRQQAAVTYAGRLVLKMVEWFKLVPKAGTGDADWVRAYGVIEALLKDATKHTVAGLGDAFAEQYEREAQ